MNISSFHIFLAWFVIIQYIVGGENIPGSTLHSAIPINETHLYENMIQSLLMPDLYRSVRKELSLNCVEEEETESLLYVSTYSRTWSKPEFIYYHSGGNCEEKPLLRSWLSPSEKDDDLAYYKILDDTTNILEVSTSDIYDKIPGSFKLWRNLELTKGMTFAAIINRSELSAVILCQVVDLGESPTFSLTFDYVILSYALMENVVKAE